MSAKRFKTLSGYVTNVSPVKEGKNRHNWAEGHIQTGSNTEEKVLFFFEKPKLSSSIYENALVALSKKGAVSLSGLSEDKDGKQRCRFLCRFVVSMGLCCLSFPIVDLVCYLLWSERETG